MSCLGRSIACSLSLLGWLALAGAARAVAPEIKDDAKFFSPDAVKKANEEIREIMRKFNRDLLIETFATPQGDQEAKVKEMSREERRKFFVKWANERTRDRVVNGVYILISKSPSHVQIEVTPRARSVFDDRAVEKLVEILLTDFREKRFDDGLAAAVKFVREKLAAAASR